MNKVILIGNVGDDPKVTTFDNGQITRISLATSRGWKNQAGEKQTATEWHNLSIGGKLAEVAEKYVKKGDKLAVEGEIRYKKWTDSGVDKFFTEIYVNSFEMLGSKNQNSETPIFKGEKSSDTVSQEEPDDLPF